jgi:hypothetical protein
VWELGCPERVAGGGDADSMLQFWLEKGDDGTKRCRKIKWRLRARLVSMKTKRDIAWRRRPEEWRHQRGEREEMTPVKLTQILLGQKIKKIHMVDSVATNRL